jgi:hypothetical protein
MFGIKRRERPDGDRVPRRSLDRGGFPGLEGDFETERRRALSAGADTDADAGYGYGEDVTPVLPVATTGLTHP